MRSPLRFWFYLSLLNPLESPPPRFDRLDGIIRRSVRLIQLVEEVGRHALYILMLKDHAWSLQCLHHGQLVDNVRIVSLTGLPFIENCHAIPAAEQTGQWIVKVVGQAVVTRNNRVEGLIGFLFLSISEADGQECPSHTGLVCDE